ncbi:MAG: hypothetical protein EA397_12300 [Deltaproteobacteria bacterium]|nr:MAG: hypothetical protein EA397_12300 [Deltaproteobacteria bacterium]
MIALFLKDSSSLWPHWIAIFALLALDVTLRLFDSSLTLDGMSSRVASGSFAAFLLFIITFAIGHTLVAPEVAEGQVEFLDSLPTSRSGIFLSKTVAGALPCSAWIGTSMFLDLVQLWLAPGLPESEGLWPILYQNLILITPCVAGYGLGLVLSWFRVLAWGVLVVAFVMLGMISVVYPPLQEYMPMSGGWGQVVLDLRAPTHPPGPLVVWPVLGLLGALSSFLLFLGPGAFLLKQGSWATGAVRIVTAGVMTLALLAIGGVASFILLTFAPTLITQGIQVHTTEHLRVLYRDPHADHALAIAAEIDEISARVGALLDQPDPLSLDVELLGAAENHAGVFTGGRIRVEQETSLYIVAHELTHAHSFHLSGPAAWRLRSHNRFFEEGLASWVEAKLQGRDPLPDIAAAIHRRDPVSFALLVEDNLFRRERDLAQVYPIGQAFVAALDDFGGAPTRRCVLEAQREFGLRRVTGLSLWSAIAERCDFDLDLVVRHMEAMLHARAKELPKLPLLSVRVERDQLRVWAREAVRDWPEILCRFRPAHDAEVTNYVYVPLRQDLTCSIPHDRLRSTSFDYQVGVVLGEDVVFDRWSTSTKSPVAVLP